MNRLEMCREKERIETDLWGSWWQVSWWSWKSSVLRKERPTMNRWDIYSVYPCPWGCWSVVFWTFLRVATVKCLTTTNFRWINYVDDRVSSGSMSLCHWFVTFTNKWTWCVLEWDEETETRRNRRKIPGTSFFLLAIDWLYNGLTFSWIKITDSWWLHRTRFSLVETRTTRNRSMNHDRSIFDSRCDWFPSCLHSKNTRKFFSREHRSRLCLLHLHPMLRNLWPVHHGILLCTRR